MNIKLQKILDWNNNKPQTDEEWIKDVEQESLHVKYDYQLEEMEKSHIDKLPQVQKDLDKCNNYPEAVKYELNRQFSEMFEEQDNPNKVEGKTLQQWIDGEFVEQSDYYNWKKGKLNQSIERIKKERDLRIRGIVVADKDDNKKAKDLTGIPVEKIRKIKGTTYYIDSDNGNDGADGLTPTGDATNGPWATLDQFTENARTAGDVAILRRGMTARYDNGSDLLFTSDGTVASPIVIEAAYADEWGDDVDLSGTETATLIFGSKTITFSGDISGVLAVGDFIYVSGDGAKEFAYEVAVVTTEVVTLFLPYKGDQVGSGKTMINMQSPPIWNMVTGDFQWNFDADDYWKVQGIHIRGTDFNGNVELDTVGGQFFKDVIMEGNGSSDYGLKCLDDSTYVHVYKSRFNNQDNGAIYAQGGAGGFPRGTIFKDVYLHNSVIGFFLVGFSDVILDSVEVDGATQAAISFSTNYRPSNVSARNLNLSGSADEFDSIDHALSSFVHSEDHNNVIGASINISGLSDAEDWEIIKSVTTPTRSGGSNISIEVTPTTKLSTNWDLSNLKVFEHPIFTTTAEKTYTVYFRPTATADWTDDPVNTELWIELEAWGHVSNNFRKITKSTGVIDMNGSTSWQALTVTITPAQAGVAYLRCYYAKTKEGGKANTFFVDPLPVIS